MTPQIKQPNNQTLQPNQTLKQSNNEYGIIRGMKKNAKSALAMTLAIAGAFAAPLCSDAAFDSIAPTTVQSVVASNEARAEKGLTFVLDVLAGWRGESAFASAEVQDHGEGAAGDCEWVGYSTTLYSTKGVRPFCLDPFASRPHGRPIQVSTYGMAVV